MKAVLTKLIFASVFAALFASAAAAQDSLPDLVKMVKPSAVAIETFDQKGKTLARGSGFFIDTDRVITNRHVIERSSRVMIHLLNGKAYPVRGVLAVDGEGDLALLQVDVPRESAVPLQVVRSVPQEGESIVVIGNPFGLEGSVSNGIVSAVREISGYGKIIQITAPISPGSSGSPVVNMYGQVIGVATLQAAEGESLNFAVPSERILQLKVGAVRTFSSLANEGETNKRSTAERFYSQGVAQLSLDDFGRALPFFERAAEIDPNYAEAWYQAGFCYGVLGRHEESLRASQKAADLKPDWAEAWANIGASNFALQKFDEAFSAYRNAVKLDDRNAETHYALGLTLSKLGRTEEEALEYKRTIALKPDHSRAMEKLGLVYMKLKRWGEAAAAFDQLKNYRPDSKTYNYLGVSLFEDGKTDASIDALNYAVNFSPDFDEARYNLGRAYLKAGNRTMAQAQLDMLRMTRSDWADRLYVLLEP